MTGLDSIEAITNATVGLLVSVAAVRFLWPVFGWEASTSQSVAVTGLFWCLSAVRSFAVRKAFRWLGS